MRKMLTGLCIILVLSAATLVHGERVDLKRFGGQCAVATEVDDFTDEKSAELVCFGNGDNKLGKHGVFLACTQKVFGTLLAADSQLHMDETIDVAYRFDKEKLVTESWRYSGNSAANRDKAVHQRFVEGLAKAKKLVFKVGDEAIAVDLTGSVGAVTEYKKRCAAFGRPIK